VGIFETDINLFGLAPEIEDQGVFLLGADRLGRDLFSRLCYGARISLSIGLVGVFLSLALGIVLGGISGYYGGTCRYDHSTVIEFIRTIPTIPLWMALSAALPADWPVLRMYFGITIILSLDGLDGDGASGAWAFPVFAPGRLCAGRAAEWIERVPHHHPAYGPLVLEPHHRQPDAFDPRPRFWARRA
jgi:hypothetical protein